MRRARAQVDSVREIINARLYIITIVFLEVTKNNMSKHYIFLPSSIFLLYIK